MPGARIVGRSTELARIGRFLDGVRSGPSAMTIVGDAGIGKTTLLDEANRRAEERGLFVLPIRAYEQEDTLAYVGLSDLFAARAELLPRVPRPQRTALEVALMLSDATSPNQRAVGLGVLAALRLSAASNPTLLSVDDAQWLDPSTARVLRFALRRLTREPIRLLITCRSGSPTPLVEPPLPNLRSNDLLVGGLNGASLDVVLKRGLGRRVRDSTLEELRKACGGNPLFALEIAREAVRVGRRVEDGEPLPIPDNLLTLLDARLRRLDESTRDLLLMVAAASRPTPALLERALGGTARSTLAAALQAGVLRFENGRLRFTHPLLASAVYGRQDDAARREAHRRLANSVDDAEERGRHLALASDIPSTAVSAALDVAAAAARTRGATDAAALLSEHALRLTPPENEDDLARRASHAADDLFVIGELERSRAVVLELAERLPHGPRRARVLRRVARAQAYASGFATTEALFRTALADAADDPATRVLLEHDLGEAFQQYGRLNEAAPHCDAALAIAETMGDPRVLDRVRGTRDILRFFQGHGLPADTLLEAREPRTDDSPLGGLHIPMMLKYTDQFGPARTLLEQLVRDMQARGGDGLLGPALFHLAELECWAGDPERSRELVRDLQRALSRVKYGGMRTRVAYATALVYAHSGEIKRARRLATTYVEAAAQSGDLFLTIRLEALLGFIALSSGDPPLAAEHLRRASAISEACGYGEPGVVRYAGDEIEALIASGDIAAARASLELLEQRSTRLHRPWGQVIGARSHALIAAATGDVETALALATASIPLLDRLEQPLERGRTLMTIGILHRRLKNRSSARDALAAADAMFTEIGASTWSRQARAEIDRISGRRRQAGGLTPTESRIADMAAAGRTNKEVAAEIHLSVKTVEANLSRIYRKLAVRSRSELAARRRSE